VGVQHGGVVRLDDLRSSLRAQVIDVVDPGARPSSSDDI